MTWDDFWCGSLDRLGAYWQANQFSIERRNQELWLQGMYIQEAVGAVLDSKHRVKYPDKPYRITEMTDAEREAENQRKIAEMRNALMAHKQRWDSTHKGVGAVDR